MTKSPVKLTPTKQLTHVCFIIDRSGSMGVVRDDVVRTFNAQASVIRDQAQKQNQATRVSLITFSSEVDQAVFWNSPISELGLLLRENYKPTGNTALFDAVGKTINDLDAIEDSQDENTSFLLVVLTDGEENWSRSQYKSPSKLGELIRKMNATDRWTITFLVPPTTDLNLFSRLGIASGNVQRWDTSIEGIQEMEHKVATGLSSFYVGRAAGVRSIKTFFSPDLSKLTKKTVKRNLDDVTKNFKVFEVFKVSDIRSFIESMGVTYIPGRAFYQLTKKETVQGYKEFCLLGRDSKIYKGDDEARDLIEIPRGGAIELYPTIHPDYTVFIQSTSVNRRLMPGTKVLYQTR